jgi:hypothetical protein
MLHSHANINQHILTDVILKNFSKRFPTMDAKIALQEMVKTAISSGLQLGANTKPVCASVTVAFATGG